MSPNPNTWHILFIAARNINDIIENKKGSFMHNNSWLLFSKTKAQDGKGSNGWRQMFLRNLKEKEFFQTGKGFPHWEEEGTREVYWSGPARAWGSGQEASWLHPGRQKT